MARPHFSKLIIGTRATERVGPEVCPINRQHNPRNFRISPPVCTESHLCGNHLEYFPSLLLSISCSPLRNGETREVSPLSNYAKASAAFFQHDRRGSFSLLFPSSSAS